MAASSDLETDRSGTGFVCTLAVLLNIQAIRNSQPTELTTAAAMAFFERFA